MSPEAPKCAVGGCPDFALLGMSQCRAHHIWPGQAIPCSFADCAELTVDTDDRHAGLSYPCSRHSKGWYGPDGIPVLAPEFADPDSREDARRARQALFNPAAAREDTEPGRQLIEALGSVAKALNSQYGDALEQVCEQMLTDPRGWGVQVEQLETSLEFGATVARAEMHWRIGLHPDVPFGQIRIMQM